MIKLAKKDTMQGYGHPIYPKDNNNNFEKNNNFNNSDSKNNILNSNLSIINSTKDNNKKNLENQIKDISNNKLRTYGAEETNNLMKFFGTPYYPEDINDEVYPGEIFEIISQRVSSNNIYEEEFSPPRNLILSYDTQKNNNATKIKNKLLGLAPLSNIQNNSVSNNFTINNNYITNNVINNLNSSKNNMNLNITSFYVTLLNNDQRKNKMNKFTIYKSSFEIIPLNKSKNSDSSDSKEESSQNDSNEIENTSIFKNYQKKFQKRLNKRNTLNNENIDFRLGNEFFKSNENINANLKKTRHFSLADVSNLVIKKKESDSSSISSSNEGSSQYNSSYNSYSNHNSDSNIFSCTPKSKHFRYSIKSIKSPFGKNRNKNNKQLRVYKNIVIKIKGEYENINMITNGQIKSKKLQSYLKEVLIKKLRVLSKKTEKSEKIIEKIEKIEKNEKIEKTERTEKIEKIEKTDKIEEPLSPKKGKKTTIKLKKHKTMAKKLPKKFSNNLYKVTLAPDNMKKTEVKSLFKKPMISDIKNSLAPVKKSINPAKRSMNNSPLKETNKDSSCCSPKRGKTRKYNDEKILHYVNRNIRDDNAVLNNPGLFYNGLFNNIMKSYTIRKRKQTKVGNN